MSVNTPLNVPQSGGQVAVPTISQIPLTDIHNAKNLYTIPLSHAKQLRFENFSPAAMLIQLVPAGSNSPFVFTIVPGGVENLDGETAYDTCIVSNLTDTPLPYAGVKVAGGALTTGYLQVAGLTGRGTIASGSPVPQSTVTLANGTVVGVSGNVGINGNVPVVSGGSAGLPISHQTSQMIATYSVPAGVADVHHIAIPAGISTIIVCLWNSFINPGNNWKNMVYMYALGVQTGVLLLDNSQPSDLPIIIPFFSGDTTLELGVQAGASSPIPVTVFGSNVTSVVGVQNVGSAPLTVQPASGSAQTVLPGTAVSAVQHAQSTPLFSYTDIGAPFVCPTGCYGAHGAIEHEYSGAVLPAGACHSVYELGLHGLTSGVRLPLLTLSDSAVAPSAANVNGGGFALNGSNSGHAVFPFPLPLKSIFTPTENLSLYQGVVTQGWNNGVLAFSVFTG